MALIKWPFTLFTLNSGILYHTCPNIWTSYTWMYADGSENARVLNIADPWSDIAVCGI